MYMATYLRDLEAAIDAEIEALLSQSDEGSEAPNEPTERNEPKMVSLAGKASTDDADDTPTEPRSIVGKRPRSRAPVELRPLSARVYRLDQLKRWMRDDPDLFQFLDNTIDKQVKAAQERQQEMASVAQKQQQQSAKTAERRQRIFSIIGAVITLIAGWLLSLVGTPATVAHLFGW